MQQIEEKEHYQMHDHLKPTEMYNTNGFKSPDEINRFILNKIENGNEKRVKEDYEIKKGSKLDNSAMNSRIKKRCDSSISKKQLSMKSQLILKNVPSKGNIKKNKLYLKTKCMKSNTKLKSIHLFEKTRKNVKMKSSTRELNSFNQNTHFPRLSKNNLGSDNLIKRPFKQGMFTDNLRIKKETDPRQVLTAKKSLKKVKISTRSQETLKDLKMIKKLTKSKLSSPLKIKLKHRRLLPKRRLNNSQTSQYAKSYLINNKSWMDDKIIDLSDAYKNQPVMYDNRANFIFWLIDTIQDIGFYKEDKIISRTIILVDLVFSHLKNEKITAHKITKIGFTAMWIAAKYELYYVRLEDMFSKLGPELIKNMGLTPETFLDYEANLLALVDFRISFPIHIDFLNNFIYQIFSKGQNKSISDSLMNSNNNEEIFSDEDQISLTSTKSNLSIKLPKTNQIAVQNNEKNLKLKQFSTFFKNYRKEMKQYKTKTKIKKKNLNQKKKKKKTEFVYVELKNKICRLTEFYFKILYQTYSSLQDTDSASIACLILSYEDLKKESSKYFENIKLLRQNKIDFFKNFDDINSMKTINKPSRRRLLQFRKPISKFEDYNLLNSPHGVMNVEYNNYSERNTIDREFNYNHIPKRLSKKISEYGNSPSISINKSLMLESIDQDIEDRWDELPLFTKSRYTKQICMKFLSEKIQNIMHQFNDEEISIIIEDVSCFKAKMKFKSKTKAFISKNHPGDSEL